MTTEQQKACFTDEELKLMIEAMIRDSEMRTSLGWMSARASRDLLTKVKALRDEQANEQFQTGWTAKP